MLYIKNKDIKPYLEHLKKNYKYDDAEKVNGPMFVEGSFDLTAEHEYIMKSNVSERSAALKKLRDKIGIILNEWSVRPHNIFSIYTELDIKRLRVVHDLLSKVQPEAYIAMDFIPNRPSHFFSIDLAFEYINEKILIDIVIDIRGISIGISTDAEDTEFPKEVVSSWESLVNFISNDENIKFLGG